MPLRDHFRPPLTLRHSWDELHGGWPMKIVESLLPNLPPDYVAAPQIHLGGSVEVDVATFEHERLDADEYEVRVYDVTRGRRLVAAVELVSPSNKDRPETRRAFVAKCAALLRQQVSVTIVDVVTNCNFNLYAELLAYLQPATLPTVVDPSNTYAVTYRGKRPDRRWLLEAGHRPLVLGEPLPTLPLWLTDDLPLSLELEASYEATCRVLRIG